MLVTGSRQLRSLCVMMGVAAVTVIQTSRAHAAPAYWTLAEGDVRAAVSNNYNSFVYKTTWWNDSTSSALDDRSDSTPYATASVPVSTMNNSAQATYGGFTAQGQAAGTATFGALHATAQAQGSVNPVNGGAKATARSHVAFLDAVTITSATLPAGTPVQFNLTIHLDSTITDPQNAAFQWNLVSKATGTTAALTGTVSYTGGPFFSTQQIDLQDGDGAMFPTLINRTRTVTVDAYVGSEFNAVLNLTTEAVGKTGIGLVGSDLVWLSNFDNSAIASNTGLLYLDPVTSGITFTSASGTDYSSTVPEPTSLALLASAGLFLGRRQRQIR